MMRLQLVIAGSVSTSATSPRASVFSKRSSALNGRIVVCAADAGDRPPVSGTLRP